MSTTEKDLREHFNQKYSSFRKTLNGSQSPKIDELREHAINALNQNGFPLTRDEEYKYTPITRALLKSFKFTEEHPDEITMVPPFGEHLISGLNGYILVFWNGKLVFNSGDTPKNLSISPLQDLSKEQQERLSQYLGKLVNYQLDAYAALNTALLNQGSVITLKEGTNLDQPVVIYHLTDASQGPVYTQTRHLILAEKNAKATVIEIYKNLSEDHQGFQNVASEIYLEDAAQLDLFKIQTDTAGALLVDNTNIEQKDNSQVRCHTITTTGDIIRNNLNISVKGQNCESHMNGLYLVNGTSLIDNHTLVDHRMPNSYSNELYKGIVDDTATGVFNGKIYVQPDAQKTNAFQSNKNILLSDKATMNTKPQLEIWANDVKCSHGATTGQLDAEQVFYLRSRGLDEKQATGLLLYAFATEFLEQVSLPVLNEYLERIIADRLYQLKS